MRSTLGKSLAVAAFAAACSAPLQAATLLVDFNQINDAAAAKTPDSAGNYWNTVSGTAGTGTFISTNPLPLVDTEDLSTGIQLTVAFGSPGSAEGFAGAAASDTNPGPGSGLLNQAFAYTDGLFSNSNATSGITLTFSGLLASTTYNFSLYAGRNSSGNDADIGLLTGSALTGDTLVENRSLADFSITSNASGVISFRFRDTSAAGGNNAVLTALSMTQVPEPSVAWIGGIGLLAFLRRRRG